MAETLMVAGSGADRARRFRGGWLADRAPCCAA